MGQISRLCSFKEPIQILEEPDTSPEERERIADTLTGIVSVLKVWKMEVELLELYSEDLFRKISVSRLHPMRDSTVGE